jgi:DNA repair photolyase
MDWRSAILMSSTTDPYQPIAGAQKPHGRQLQRDVARMRRRALELILNESVQLVRVLTRSPLACRDFDLFKEFGHASHLE